VQLEYFLNSYVGLPHLLRDLRLGIGEPSILNPGREAVPLELTITFVGLSRDESAQLIPFLVEGHKITPIVLSASYVLSGPE
jgi:hypothetical protein